MFGFKKKPPEKLKHCQECRWFERDFSYQCKGICHCSVEIFSTIEYARSFGKCGQKGKFWEPVTQSMKEGEEEK